MHISPDRLILPLDKAKATLSKREVQPKQGSFDKVLSGTLGELKISGHALDRLNQRKINIKPEQIDLLNRAVLKASEKGARESLVLLNDLAFVVSVKNKTIITALQKGGLGEGVFTNIDSAVVI